MAIGELFGYSSTTLRLLFGESSDSCGASGHCSIRPLSDAVYFKDRRATSVTRHEMIGRCAVLVTIPKAAFR